MVSFCLVVMVLGGLMVLGYEFLCHDVWIMGSLSEWGLFFGIRFW